MIITFKALENNQCPWIWFSTQTLITEDKTLIIIWDMCQVKGGGTQLVTFIAVCQL